MPNLPGMRVVLLDPESNMLDKVIELANENSITLGFFPKGAFEQKMKENKIIVAIQDNKLLGYLLYDYNMNKHLAYVVHLCVDQNYRNMGISRILLAELERVAQGKVGGIRVRCRTDYDASDIWPKLGFTYIQTIQGRSKKGSKLDVWRKNLPFPDLFRPAVEQPNAVISACLDLNILSNFLESTSDSTVGSRAVMQDWLTEIVEFYISPELLVELKRHSDERKKGKIREFAKSINLIRASQRHFDVKRHQIADLFNDTQQDQSDLSHIAWCIAGNMDYFVTGDEKLLNKNPQIYEKTGIKLIHPSDLVLYTDILLRGLEYQPQRFGESAILIRRVTGDDFERVVTAFAQDASEGKKRFVTKLRCLLSQPQEITTELISHNDVPLGLVSYQIIPDKKLVANMVRLAPNELADTLSLGVVKWLLEKSLSQGSPCLCISDTPISVAITIACTKFGFHRVDNNLIRLTECGCLNLAEIRTKMNEHEKADILPGKYCKHVRADIDRAISSADKSSLLNIERNLWPLKIEELDIPAYVVSIRPKYAMHLFDERISSEDLFGGDSRLLLNIENSYYRSLRGPEIRAPGRILWYVGKGERHYQDKQAIRAVSYLNEVHIGKPKDIFNRFQHLGIYRWDDVLGTVQGNCEKQLMAFVFSHTEIFENPVHHSRLDEIWRMHRNKNFYVYAPVKVADRLFWEIYKSGKGLNDEKNSQT